MRLLYASAARIAGWLGALSLLLVVGAGLVTVADVIIRKSVGGGILGTTDIVQLLVMAAAFAAVPYGFFADSHVAVDLATDRLPPRALAAVKATGAILGSIVLAVIAWCGWGQALQAASYGDGSPTISLPMTWFWATLIAGSVLAGAAALLVTLRHGAIAFGQPDIAVER
jgi:TRAP-type C4-dicarboxylate transport system permease small subunit